MTQEFRITPKIYEVGYTYTIQIWLYPSMYIHIYIYLFIYIYIYSRYVTKGPSQTVGKLQSQVQQGATDRISSKAEKSNRFHYMGVSINGYKLGLPQELDGLFMFVSWKIPQKWMT